MYSLHLFVNVVSMPNGFNSRKKHILNVFFLRFRAHLYQIPLILGILSMTYIFCMSVTIS